MSEKTSLHVRIAEKIEFDEHYHVYVVKAADAFKTVPVQTPLASTLPEV